MKDVSIAGNAALAAARIDKFAAALTRASMLRDIETVRQAGDGLSTAPRHMVELQKDLMRLLDAWEEG